VPPGETTHWTSTMMAAARNISASAVRRIWKAHGLQPHQPAVQALERSQICREAPRCRRAVCRSASARHRAVV
jgi:hypothetical protein